MSRTPQRSSRDHAQGWRNAWAVSGQPIWWLTGALVAWALFARWQWGDDRMWAAWRGGSLVPLAVDGGAWWRLVTAGFLHLELKHLAVNAVALALVGRLAQRVFGTGRALLVFFSGAMVGSLASLITPDGWSLGASAGVFAMLGALVSGLFRLRHDTPRSWRRRAQRQVLPWVLALAAITLAQLPGADHFAHVGATLWGVLCGTFLGAIPLGRPAWTPAVKVGSGVAMAVLLAAIWVGLIPQRASPAAVVWTHGDAPGETPKGWVVGPAVAPCETSLTDGLRFLCGFELPIALSEAEVHRHIAQAGYRIEPSDDSGTASAGWSVYRVIREKAAKQFGRVCIRRTDTRWHVSLLRSPSHHLYYPSAGCSLGPAQPVSTLARGRDGRVSIVSSGDGS